MSLVALAARLITIQALSGATLAGPRVYDSAIDPIDQRITEEAAPVLIVFTEDDASTVTGRDITNASRELDLVIEIAAANRVVLPNPEGQGEVEMIEIPHTDAGLEIIIDLIRRQAMRVLMSDPGPWPTLWRRIVLAPRKITSRRGAGSEKGAKFAARQIVITTETLAEPGYGAAAAGFWADFLSALEGASDQGLKNLAPLIRAEIETPSLVEWRRQMAELGANEGTAWAIGLGPVMVDPDPAEEPAGISEVTVAQDGAADWPLNEEAANDALGPES